MTSKWYDISHDIFTHVENVTAFTPEEYAAEKKKNSKLQMDSAKPEFTLQTVTNDFIMAMWGNVTGRAQTIRKIEFNNYKSALPH